jgi:CRP/FNR family transcriptional regulator
MTHPAIPLDDDILARSLREAGAVPRRAVEGQTAFRWQGQPKAFVFLTSGALSVHVRTRSGRALWATCGAEAGEDCVPVTAAILSGCHITVWATCATGPCAWLELPPRALLDLVHDDPAFRRALFAGHAARMPGLLAQRSSDPAMGVDRRLARWLLGHAALGRVVATHQEIAADLLTAREVVSRKLRDFALRAWIVQERGRIRVDAPAALSRLSRGGFALPVCKAPGAGGPLTHPMPVATVEDPPPCRQT